MAPLLALAFASTLQLCGTSPSHDIEANLRGSNSPACSPSECCKNGRYTKKDSGGTQPPCGTSMAHPALVAIARHDTHHAANPTWQRLHISIPSNTTCISYLEGANLSFEFDGFCGKKKCYHYWKISKFMHAEGKNITKDGLTKNCGFATYYKDGTIAKCAQDGSKGEIVHGWHATVSKLLYYPTVKAKQDWLNSKKWTLQTWKIEDLGVPFAKCTPPPTPPPTPPAI